MADLVEDRLHISERSARNRVAESLLFESDEAIEAAFGRGEVSILQAHLIRRLARTGQVEPFVERARQVTWRQFQREYRLLVLMGKCKLGEAARRPFSQERIEEMLIEALGGDKEAVEEALCIRGVPPLPEGGSTDPAENPILMDRLEAMVQLLALRQWDEVPATGEADRQTFAALKAETWTRFWLRTTTYSDLREVLWRYRKEHGPGLPCWAAMTLLFHDARKSWDLEDPERRPARASFSVATITVV